MKRFHLGLIPCCLLVFCFASPRPAEAARLETGGATKDLSFGINGFLDFEYAYMSKMPMVMDTNGTEVIGTMPGTSSISLQHLNLLVSAEKENLRVLINLHTQQITASGPDQTNTGDEIAIQEAYGEYIFRDFLRIRAGSFLAPFGIYNDVRYILPIFSSVVLPQIYDPPANYSRAAVTGKAIESVAPMTPEDGNLMFWGQVESQGIDFRYHFYLSNGTKQNGAREDRDLGIGGRLLLNAQDKLKIGASAYTVHNKGAPEGRAHFFGGDVTFSPSPHLTLQGEYVVNRYANRRSRYSYYFDAAFPYLQWVPYLRYDVLKDPEHLLMKRKQERYTLGLGYRFKPNLQVKTEYHYHRIVDRSGLPSGLASFNMLRFSLILMF